LSRRFGADRPKLRFEAELSEIVVGGRKVLLLAPQTYMNNSGRSVRQLVDFYQVPAESVLVACDDINLPLGRIRIRASGSSGGQKGLQDIIRHLGTEVVPRLRIGVGSPPGQMDSADYVLARFGTAEREVIDQAIVQGANAVELWVTGGLSSAMNRFNSSPATEADGKGEQGSPD
jgi:peptidyl-tRNA hydrolase, PTH1 family